jgi:hypothetical protein
VSWKDRRTPSEPMKKPTQRDRLFIWFDNQIAVGKMKIFDEYQQT